MLNNTLEEISNWSIEAKEEDTSKYFFHFNDVGLIEKGVKNYVIGRKGTGKTAIAEYIHREKSHDRFSRLLSFKNFPFSYLYKFSDSNYNRPNQYITIWKYVIFHYICSMMAENEYVSSNCKFDIRQKFNFDVIGALSKSVTKITEKSYKMSLFGVELGFSNEKIHEEFDFSDANDILKKFIIENIDDKKYYIIFDELDEDYRDILSPDRKSEYFELLISLFKAVHSIRSEFSSGRTNIFPIIFLRDDIFDLCRDNDKNKWLDRAVVLKWDEPQLYQLIKFRLSRALNSNGKRVSMDESWEEVFSVTKTRYGTSGKHIGSTFKYMIDRTFLRPRDIISYIRECAKISLSRGAIKIDNRVIKDAAEAHSSYMRREIIDEVFSVLDDISEVLDVVSKIRKQVFFRKEFNDRYREYVNNTPEGKIGILTEGQVLKILYHFNIVGNVTSGGRRVFAYSSDSKVLNTDERLCVHHGLLRSLNIT